MTVTVQARTIRHLVFIAILSVFAILTGCASTKVEIRGLTLKEALCRTGAPPLSLQVYWTTQWRPDQKEPQLREAAALRGLQDFFAGSGCLSLAAIERLPSDQTLPSNAELLQWVASRGGHPDFVIFVVTRELGPKLVLGLPVIVEGGTEVVIDVRVLAPKTQQVVADSQTLWRNGGMFVVKGVNTLASDMGAALNATLIDHQATQ